MIYTITTTSSVGDSPAKVEVSGNTGDWTFNELSSRDPLPHGTNSTPELSVDSTHWIHVFLVRENSSGSPSLEGSIHGEHLADSDPKASARWVDVIVAEWDGVRAVAKKVKKKAIKVDPGAGGNGK